MASGEVLGPQPKSDGICVFDARPVPPAKHKCIAWWEGICVEHYGTLKGYRR
jgi:hypothetical protein